MTRRLASFAVLLFACYLSLTCVESTQSGPASLRGNNNANNNKHDRKLVAGGGLAGLELIYTSTTPQQPVIMNLKLGTVNVVNFQTLGLPATAKFNINAVKANDDSVGSVYFTNGRPESSLPWAYCGNTVGPIYFDCPDLVLGATVNVTVIPFPLVAQQGVALPPIWTVIQFVDTIAPLPRPVPPPVNAPVTPAPPKCKLPQIIGSWESGKLHPFPVAEAQGAMIGKHRIIVGGFLSGYTSVSTQTHVLDTSNSSATWQRMDDYPFPLGITHAAFVVVGSKFYMCGGYAGGGIGLHIDVCLVYDHSKPRGRAQQWARFASLPQGGRAGGGMVYDSTLNALIFSAGTTRVIPQQRISMDHNNTWMLSLANPSAGWVERAPIPFLGNHMSFVTAKDANGKERHFFTGGQKQEDEHDGNQAEHFEYDAVNNVWIKRRFMPIPRSHAASSTRPFGCGFIVVAGCTNGGQRISDISYYDIPTDSWTTIGNLPDSINTPVCDISNGVLYCDTGWDSGSFSKQVAIGGVPQPTAPVRAPVSTTTAPIRVPQPTAAPAKPIPPPMVAPNLPPQKATQAPVAAPVALLSPTVVNLYVPQIVGNWESSITHPFPVAEAQGAAIGKHLIIVGGFLAGYGNVSTQTHVFDTSNPAATWQRMDDYPFPMGVTHAAFAVAGTKFYMCGGFAGGGVGLHTDVCMVYDHSKPRGRGQQWSRFAPLPNGGRGGGGMIYDRARNALVFSSGATRPVAQQRIAVDRDTTWMYSLANPSAGWVVKAPIPFVGNHISSVTALDSSGRERHYFTGGQREDNEQSGNQVEHFEYDVRNNTWIKRRSMTLARSHAASSTVAIGSGFIVVAGCTNGHKISDISYYDISTDTWTKIGDLPTVINTPVCDIVSGVLYCNTGWDSGMFSHKIRIIPGLMKPSSTPVLAPVVVTTSPLLAPMSAPVRALPPPVPSAVKGTNAPVVAPMNPPMKTCSIPKLVGTWGSGVTHPFPVAEAQGAMIGNHHVIVGGFLAGYGSVSLQTHALDTSNASATWQRMDDYPFPGGITHGAFVVVGSKFYMCGGYAGGGIGMHTDACMVYDHSKPPGKGLQWSKFAPLPNGGRAGGGMVYDSARNALIFSGGATRPIAHYRSAVDYNTTWMYSLGNPSAGWVAKASMPFHGNHMSSVTAKDANGKERHYFTGGQKEEDEPNGNQAEHFEYDVVNDVWIKRRFMTIPRSHAASSTRAIGCGFIIVAGCTNNGERISDISYYDTSSDTWTKIGNLPDAINTPVCGIAGGTLYCDTGWDAGSFSKKIGIAV